MRHFTRITTWYDPQGSARQVAVAILEADTWDVLSECVEDVGPFDDASEAMLHAREAALALAAGQYPGQQTLIGY